MNARTVFLILVTLVALWMVNDLLRSKSSLDNDSMMYAIQDQINPDWIDGNRNIGTIKVVKIKSSNWIKIDEATKTYSCDMKIEGNYTLRNEKQGTIVPFETTRKMEVIKGKPKSIRLIE